MNQQNQPSSLTLLNFIKERFSEVISESQNHPEEKIKSLQVISTRMKAKKICAQQILLEVIEDKMICERLKWCLLEYLEKYFSREHLLTVCKKQDTDIQSKILPIEGSKTCFMKDLINNINLVDSEIKSIRKTLDFFDDSFDSARTDQALSQITKVSLKKLINTFLNQEIQEISEDINQIAFRLFILEESISLIFAKTQALIEKINRKPMLCESQEPTSKCSSEKKKKSSLSASLMIYLENKQKEEKSLEQEQSLKKAETKEQEKFKIKVDYKISKKTDNKGKAVKKERVSCCGLF